MARQYLVGLAASATLLCGQCIALVLVRSTVWRRLTSALSHDLLLTIVARPQEGLASLGYLSCFIMK
jgi:hypothetical protein